MKRMITVIIFLFFILFPFTLYARECDIFFIKYKIDPEIKSSDGWVRVINKKELNSYIINNICKEDDKILKDCLIKNGFKIKNSEIKKIQYIKLK